MPIPAIEMHMTTADMINNGFRPDLSTTNSVKMLLINWTSPTIIVAKLSFTELPNNSDKIFSWSDRLASRFDLPFSTWRMKNLNGEKNDRIDTTNLLQYKQW